MWIKNSDYGMLTFTFISHLGDTLCMEAQIRNHWTTITPNSVQTNAVNALKTQTVLADSILRSEVHVAEG